MTMVAREPLTDAELAARAEQKRIAREKLAEKDLQKATAGVLSDQQEVTQHEARPATGSVRSQSDREKARRVNVFSGNTRQLEVVGEIPGYQLRIFNDYPGRIDKALSGGWEMVGRGEVELQSSNKVTDLNTSVDSTIRWNVGVQKDNSPLYAYLMKIRKEWWDEDHENQQAEIDKVQMAMQERGGYDADKVGNAVMNKGRAQGMKITSTLDGPKR
jgi:hypothetical protein